MEVAVVVGTIATVGDRVVVGSVVAVAMPVVVGTITEIGNPVMVVRVVPMTVVSRRRIVGLGRMVFRCVRMFVNQDVMVLMNVIQDVVVKVVVADPVSLSEDPAGTRKEKYSVNSKRYE